MIVRVLLVIFASLVLSLTITYSLNYWDDFNVKLFYNQDSDSDEKKIFLIGSSQTRMLDAIFIEKYIETTQNDFKVHNLGIPLDNPKKRINELQDIIDIKPTIVVYGVSFRDFTKSVSKQTPITDVITQTKPNQTIIDPEKFFQSIELEESFNYVCEGCGELFKTKYFENPQKTTIKFINALLGKDADLEFLNQYFFTYGKKTYEVNNESVLKQQYEQFAKKNKNFIVYGNEENINSDDLEEIIFSLKKNNISVILFSVPYPSVYLEKISESDIEIFTSILEKISKENDLKVYHLYDKYAELNIWRDIRHVSMTNTTSTYSLDVAKIILQEIEQ